MWLKDRGRAISPPMHIPFKSLVIAMSVTERQDVAKASGRKINKKNLKLLLFTGANKLEI